MGKVWFYFDKNNSSEMSNAYVCHSAFNRSGDYYTASDYKALEAKLAALILACERVLQNMPLYGYNLEPRDILRNAIAAAKGAK